MWRDELTAEEELALKGVEAAVRQHITGFAPFIPAQLLALDDSDADLVVDGLERLSRRVPNLLDRQLQASCPWCQRIAASASTEPAPTHVACLSCGAAVSLREAVAFYVPRGELAVATLPPCPALGPRLRPSAVASKGMC